MNTNGTQGQQGQQPVVLPDPKTAYDHLVTTVYHGGVFDTLARHYGFSPMNEKEAQEILELSGKLRALEQDPRVKQANAATNNSSPFARANRDLDNAMARHGLDGPVKQAAAREADLARNQLAARLAADPRNYNAVLSCKAAEADQVATQLGLRPPTQAA